MIKSETIKKSYKKDKKMIQDELWTVMVKIVIK